MTPRDVTGEAVETPALDELLNLISTNQAAGCIRHLQAARLELSRLKARPKVDEIQPITHEHVESQHLRAVARNIEEGHLSAHHDRGIADHLRRAANGLDHQNSTIARLGKRLNGPKVSVEEAERLMDEARREAGEDPGDLSATHWEAIYAGVEKIRSRYDELK